MDMRNRIVWLLLSAIVLTACSGIPRRESDEKELARYQPYTGEPIREFSTMPGISGWNSLSDDKRVVWTGINNAYLLTIAQPCSNLAFTNSIGISSMTSRITTFDFVRVRGGERCPITEIRPIDYRRMQADLRQKNAK
jgi:hypothetical protein